MRGDGGGEGVGWGEMWWLSKYDVDGAFANEVDGN